MADVQRQLRQRLHIGAGRGGAHDGADAVDPAGEVGVGVVEGGDGVAEGPLVDFGDGPALVGEFGDVALVVLDGALALVRHGFEGGLLDELLALVADAVPHVLGADHHQRGVDVLGERQVLQGGLVVLLGDRREDRRLGGVHDAVLQRREDFRAGDRRGRGAQQFHRVDVQVRLRDADLDAVEVGGHVDGPRRGHHRPEPELAEGQALQFDVLQQRQEVLADGAVEGGEDVVAVIEEVRQVQHAELRDERFHDPREHHGDVHRTDLRALHELALAAQLAAGEHLDGEATARALLHDLLELHRRDIGEPIGRTRMADVQRQLRQRLHIGRLRGGRRGRFRSRRRVGRR